MPNAKPGTESHGTPAGVPTKEIVKGDRIKTRDGYVAEVRDNRKTHSAREVMLHGPIGDGIADMAVFDMASVERNGKWVPVALTAKQLESQRLSDTVLGRKPK